MTLGEQCVMITGQLMMPMYCVNSLVTLSQVGLKNSDSVMNVYHA